MKIELNNIYKKPYSYQVLTNTMNSNNGKAFKLPKAVKLLFPIVTLGASLKDEFVSNNLGAIISTNNIFINDKPQENREVINEILKHKELYGNKRFFKSILNNSENFVGTNFEKGKMILLKRFITDKNIYSNEALVSDFPQILLMTYDQTSLNVKLQLLDKFSNDKNITENDKLNKIFSEILQFVFRQTQADIATKILGNKDIISDESKIPSIFEIVKRTGLAYNDITKEFFNNPKFYENDFLFYDLPNFQETTFSSNGTNLIESILLDDKNLSNFLEFQKEALKQENFVNSGYKQHSKKEILEITSTRESLMALSLLSKRNLEAAFSLNIDGYNDFCEDISNMTLSDANRELLLSKINPKGSMSYDWYNMQIRNLKESLSGLLTKTDKDKIKKLREEKDNLSVKMASISKEIKSTESRERQNNLKEQYKELHKQNKNLINKIQSIYMKSDNYYVIQDIMQQISSITKKRNDLLQRSMQLSPQEVIEKVKVIASINSDYSDDEVKKFIDLIKPSSKENDEAWNKAIEEKIYKRLLFSFDKKVMDKIGLMDCRYLSKMLVSNDEFYYNFGKLICVVEDNMDKSFEEIFDSLPQNLETKKIFEQYGIDYEKWTKPIENSFVSVKTANNDESKLKVRKVNMYDVKNALCLGNDAGCCTGLGKKFKEYTAPTYVMNKCIGAIELVDGDKPVGNTMMYLAKVDGNLALVLDNIELKGNYRFNDSIREAFIEYAKKICSEIGKPDLKIYAGPNRHKVNMNVLPIGIYDMEVLGSTGKDEIYLDYDANRHVIDYKERIRTSLFQIR